ncbi:sulfurtransferase-like selenium metabolism protein YedF [Desulfitibacter alkalitolerans]|uniref:sulfurtransferase-like selenium metabolism protein YedF n=1 Tax=Desulfitibacter alkalitolerans TaxID=264641 RepID=UPI000480E189|nr:sulfurtransferase-like selenium metabolism protein YedF [Desulfitibacter alkalitolerans]
MDNLVDARGLACPEPVICTKKALEKLEAGTITTIVDNDVAKDNIIRFAKSFDYPVEVEKKDENYHIKIRKSGGLIADIDSGKNIAILITSKFLGRGNDELGKVLTKSFFFTLTETYPLPKTIMFINSGIILTCEGSNVLEEIIDLEKKGVEILSCGTCLDYYQLKDRLCVGSITNMYSIVEKMINNKLISV